jgi:LemA protein
MGFYEQIIGILIGLGVAVIIVIICIFTFNNLVALRNSVKKSWANVDVVLRRRQDELLALIGVVKGYKNYEKVLLTDITRARSTSLGARTIGAKAAASDKISSAVGTLFAVAEQYPDLKADAQFLRLQRRISAIENDLAAKRDLYNATTTRFNTAVESFPSLIIAKLFFFKTEPLFDAGDVSTPRVDLELSDKELDVSENKQEQRFEVENLEQKDEKKSE